MAKYGVPYMGSKSQIADNIISFLPEGKRFVDLFGGGFAMSHCALKSMKYESIYYNDLNPLIVDLVKRAINGDFNYNKFTPEFITKEKFFELKDKDGYIKYIWSFGNKGDTYLYGKDIEKYKKELHNAVVFKDFSGDIFKELAGFNEIKGNTINERRLCLHKIIKKYEYHKKYSHIKNLERLNRLQNLENIKRLEHLERINQLNLLNNNFIEISFNNHSYLDYKYKEGDVVYLDPPYENTAKYDKGGFNHKEFYDWVATRDYPVYFSSYDISDNRFKVVYQIEKRSLLCVTNKSVVKQEKIYFNNK